MQRWYDMRVVVATADTLITPLGAILMLLFNPITLLALFKLLEKICPDFVDMVCSMIADMINGADKVKKEFRRK